MPWYRLKKIWKRLLLSHRLKELQAMFLEFDISQEPSRLLLGIAYNRIYKFFMKYDAAASEAQSHVLVQTILKRLVDTDPLMRLYLCLHNNHVVGHLLFTIEKPEAVTPFLYVHQLEFDTGHADPDFMQRFFSEGDALAVQHGCTRMMMTTARRPEAFHRYGFTAFRTVMVRPIVDSLEEQHAVDMPPTASSPQSNGTLTGVTPEMFHRLQALLQHAARETAGSDATESTASDDIW
jgi:hypothetical protein